MQDLHLPQAYRGKVQLSPLGSTIECFPLFLPEW